MIIEVHKDAKILVGEGEKVRYGDRQWVSNSNQPIEVAKIPI